MPPGGAKAEASSPFPCSCPHPDPGHGHQTRRAPAHGREPGSTSLWVQRCLSRSSSSARRLRVEPASSSTSVSLAFFMCPSCSRRRAFTWERPVLLYGQGRSGVAVGGWPLPPDVLRQPGPEPPGPRRPQLDCAAPRLPLRGTGHLQRSSNGGRPLGAAPARPLLP